jgi:4-hydroxybenzoate polyprenyltransferase
MAGAASVVIIYYQQTLAKYIITQTVDQQYKWFGIIVGMIIFRFLVFNVPRG